MDVFSLPECTLSFDGRPLSGFGDDPAVTITWNGERYKKKVNSDGTVSVGKTNDRSGTATFKFRYDGPGNTVMRSIVKLEDIVGASRNRVFLAVLPNGTKFSCSKSRIGKRSGQSLGVMAGDTEWVLDLDEIEETDGTNT